MLATVVEDFESLEPHLAGWDALAVAGCRPYCAPAWMLSWWRDGRSGDARLRVVLALDGEELVAVAPFFAQVNRFGLAEMRLLAAGFCHRIGVLCRPGSEKAAATAIAGALAEMTPRPASVVFEGVDADDRWPELIAEAWPGRAPRQRSDLIMSAPTIELREGYEQWLALRDRKFRKESRRTARRMEEQGVQGAVGCDPQAIEDLLTLHHARWEQRGGSNVEDSARRVIAGAARELADAGRLKVAMLRGPQGPVAAELVLIAGDEAAFWGGGFDPEWASFAPGTQAMLLALEDLAASSTQTADLGGGAHAYKQRIADADRPVAWRTLFPRGWRHAAIRTLLLRKHVRLWLRQRLRSHPALARALRRGHA